MSAQPAKLFVNAKVFTSKKGDDGLYQSLLVHDGKVIHVGKEEDAERIAKEVSSYLITNGTFAQRSSKD